MRCLFSGFAFFSSRLLSRHGDALLSRRGRESFRLCLGLGLGDSLVAFLAGSLESPLFFLRVLFLSPSSFDRQSLPSMAFASALSAEAQLFGSFFFSHCDIDESSFRNERKDNGNEALAGR